MSLDEYTVFRSKLLLMFIVTEFRTYFSQGISQSMNLYSSVSSLFDKLDEEK